MNPALEKRIKRQIIGKPHRFLAVVPLGFEDTLVQELHAIGIETIDDISANSDGKVEWTSKITEAWKAIAYSRIANRILIHIADFKAENFRELEKKAGEIPWELYLAEAPMQHASIHVSCKHSRLYHSDAVAERLQKIIEGGCLPLAPNATNLFVTLIDDRCTIWLDLAGEELYKRGHERFVNEAPLKETIAAAMLFEALKVADSPQVTLFDPMAGSGTFSLEAAYAANRLIPGTCRDFALKHQPAFKDATWKFIVSGKDKADGKSGLLHAISKIITSDISERAVEIIKHNVECSPLAGIVPNGSTPAIQPQLRDFFSYTAQDIADACQGDTAPVIVLNPPYGKRLDFDAPKLYTQIGKKLAELSRELKQFNKALTVAILAPKDGPGAQYTCTANLLQQCPALAPKNNPAAKLIVTSHGGFTLNTFIAKI